MVPLGQLTILRLNFSRENCEQDSFAFFVLEELLNSLLQVRGHVLLVVNTFIYQLHIDPIR